MSEQQSNIVADLRGLADFLLTLEAEHRPTKRKLDRASVWLRDIAICFLEKEHVMGRAATDLKAAQAKINSLQSQLDTAKANAYDADDTATMDAFEAANPPAPATDPSPTDTAPANLTPADPNAAPAAPQVGA